MTAISRSDFNTGETITDNLGRVFVTRRGVARVLHCSLPTLSTTHYKNGLKPLKRRIGYLQVYLLEDVIKYDGERN